MSKNTIKRILVISPVDFPDELAIIRKICSQHNVDEQTNNRTGEIIFYFYDNSTWNSASEQIQLEVGNVVLKSKTKYVIIEKEMKQIIDQTASPTWFLNFQKETTDFQKQMMDFQKQTMDFQKQMMDFQKQMMDFQKQVFDEFEKNHKFQTQVLDRLDRVEARLDKIDARIDNLVKLNNLKE